MLGTDLRGKKQPIGVTTIRSDDREWIKICLEPYGDNWMLVTIPKEIKAIINELDSKGTTIRGYKRPLDGERLLDKLIVDFYVDEMGYLLKGAEMMPAEFKKVGGWDNQAKYSFNNFFTSIAMAKKQNDKLDKRKAIREIERNNWHKMVLQVGEDGAGREPIDYDFDADKVPIREISKEETEGLLKTMNEALVTLERGVNFDGEQKEAYWGAIKKSEEWPNKYRLMPEIVAEKRDMDKVFEKAFKGNHDWMVKETWDKIIEGNFDKYFNNFKEQIMVDEGKRISEKYNMKLAGNTEEFYNKFYEIMPELDGFEVDSLAKLRFKTKLGKNLNGKWIDKHIAILENTELIAQDLPLGHILTNPKLNSFNAPNFSMGLGYAYYVRNMREISFSKTYMDEASVLGLLTDPLEFFAVTPHEVGHAVSNYYRNDINPLGYKEWIYLAGWDNRQENLHATGSDKPVERLGENNEISLITRYAAKSPEECFAEYYSCYYQNKEAIDNWLDTDDPTFLSENERTSMSFINYWRLDPKTNKDIKQRQPYLIKDRGVHYRDNIVPETTMIEGRELFRFMREAIFGDIK